MERETRRAQRRVGQGPGFALRVWLWSVPVVMLVVSIVFGVIGAVDGRWALVGMMCLMGLFAVGLLALHYWAVYRFGRTE